MRPSAIFLIPPGRKAGKYLLVLNLVLAAIIGLAGCGAQQLQKMARGEIQAPKVSFQDLKIYQPTGQGWPLRAVLLLQNPNPQALIYWAMITSYGSKGRAWPRAPARNR